jgi:hypothetical protein
VVSFSVEELHRFIVKAKAATYVGSGKRLLPYRLASKDLQYSEGDFVYHDSYFGDGDFIGQEVVYFQHRPVWGMNYFGRILRPDLITSAEAGMMIKRSLSRMYEEGRFLGGFHHEEGDLAYTDTSEGTLEWFTGRKWITRGGVRVYELLYNGGLIKE